MSGEWTGWNTWEQYEKAGIVEDALDFSEEPIIIDNAVGITRDTIGKCWPMDAALAYTLMKGGPEATYTWSDMVNQFTRSAAVMMSRKVAWGDVPTPNTPSCGHDEVDVNVHSLGAPSINDSGYISFSTSYYSGQYMEDWLKAKGYTDPEVLKCANPRLKRDGGLSNIQARHIFNTPFFAPLVAVLKAEFPTSKVNADAQATKRSYQSHGNCAWKDDDKACLHHDRPTSTMWALFRKEGGDYITAYARVACSKGWNRNQWSERHAEIRSAPKNIVAWDEVRRGMAQAIPEEIVIAEIKQSLARMMKREDNIVSKEGRGKTARYSWNNWGWLASMTAHIKNTSSKNRKEGDIVNGWVYTKVRSRKSYGHEIADFVWTPEDEVKDYVVARKERGMWHPNAILSNMRFPTKAQAQEFATAIAAAHVECGGHLANRVHDGFEKSEDDSSTWSIRSFNYTSDLVMHGHVDPEDYFTPADFMTLYRNAAPAVVDEHRANFEKLPSFNITAAVKSE